MRFADRTTVNLSTLINSTATVPWITTHKTKMELYSNNTQFGMHRRMKITTKPFAFATNHQKCFIPVMVNRTSFFLPFLFSLLSVIFEGWERCVISGHFKKRLWWHKADPFVWVTPAFISRNARYTNKKMVAMITFGRLLLAENSDRFFSWKKENRRPTKHKQQLPRDHLEKFETDDTFHTHFLFTIS